MKITFHNLFKEQSWFDEFSIVHFNTGLLFYGVFDTIFNLSPRTNLILCLVIHTLYELKDFLETYEIINFKKNGFFRIFTGSPPNTLGNSIGDTIVFMLGIYLYRYLAQDIDFQWYHLTIFIFLHFFFMITFDDLSRVQFLRLFGIKPKTD